MKPTKPKYQKIQARLSEEIQRYGKIQKKGVKSIPHDHSIFISEIPFNGFKIILANVIMPKEVEHFYYARSKYGWWTFCAKKNKVDKWDDKILEKSSSQYGQYAEGKHSFCNDNQHEGSYFYNLKPDDMVEDLKQQINIFYRDREIQIARSKMTKEDYERIEKRARKFLDDTIVENSEFIKKVDQDQKHLIKTFSYKEAWIVQGKKNAYIIDEDSKAYFYDPKGKRHLQPICIMPKWNNQYIHTFDHVASRMLALMNDNKTKKFIHTIRD